MIIPPKNEELQPNESPEAKEARRRVVEELTRDYFARGGLIQVLPPCTFSKDADCAAWADLDLRKPTEKDGPKNKEKAAPDLELHKRVKA